MHYLQFNPLLRASTHVFGVLLLILQFGLPKYLVAQPHATQDGDLKLFQELLAHPESFTSEKRADIYYKHIGPYYSKGLDTAKVLFNEMLAFGVDHKDEYVMASALGALGEIYRMEGNYEQSIPFFLHALQYLDGYPEEKYLIQGGLSNVYILVDQLDSAEIYAERSLQLAIDIQDTSGFTGAYLQKGILLAHREKYYSAIQNYLLALEYADSATIPLRKVNTYALMANCYKAVRDYDNAISYAKLALAISKERKYTSTASEMNTLLGNYYLDLDSLEVAESYFLAALVDQEKNNIPKLQITIYSKLAVIASRQNNSPLANQYLQTASAFLQSDISDSHKASFYMAKGRVALDKENWMKSIRAYQQVVRIGREIGSDQFRLNGYNGLSEAYRNSGQYKTALLYRDSLSDLHQKLDLAFQNTVMLDLNQKYETNLKNEEIAKLNAMQNLQALELSQKDNQLLFSFIGLFLAIAALAGFGYALITKSRSNKVLHDKNNQLRAALENNKMLIREIHHRVKNNLQMVSSLLNLQSRFETDGTVMRAINTSKNRVQSMSLLHQHLYLNEDLNSIKVKKYFEDLTSYLISGYPLHGKEVKLKLDIEDIALDIDTVVPMGLICNELMTNALKYAYPETDQCRLWVSIKEANGKIRLVVKDNGIGTTFTVLPEKSTSMGTQLIKAFANKLKASIEIDNFEGTEFKITFERKAPFVSINKFKNVAS